jgi:hypothetical protein
MLVALWDEIFPHRTISFENGKVNVNDAAHGMSYHGKNMSDGERVALYLMGQCLCAPPGSMLVIDEPEIHLHTSIMQSMWNKLEERKRDCLFVYITHDLNFASTRVSTTIIWVRDYDGANRWTWECVPEIDELPESLLLELLGNRRTVVFVEGEKGGKDHSIYQSIYRNYSVVPRNGCDRVIESVKALTVNSAFHHLKVLGIIDRDYRTEFEIQALQQAGIYCVELAEIENVLLNEATVRLVAANQRLEPDDVIAQATAMARALLARDLERQASQRTYRIVKNRVSHIDTKMSGLPAIKTAVAHAVGAIDVDGLFAENLALFENLSKNGSLNEILKYYNNKGLIDELCAIFELGRNGYEKLVLRMLNSAERDLVIAGLKEYVPTF